MDKPDFANFVNYLNENAFPAGTSSRTSAPPINPRNPFNNPTENENYNMDYSDIVPQISIPGCAIPLKPSKAEKKRIRKKFNVSGLWIAFHIVGTGLIANIAYFLITFILTRTVPNADPNEIRQYITNSSIYMGLMLFIFLTFNLLTFFFGCKTSKIKISSLFQTEGLTVPKLLQYISIGFMLQYASALIVLLIQYLVPVLNQSSNMAFDMQQISTKGLIVYCLYACIIAPITEELLYRGFVLKSASRVNQRFGIFLSAFFFGLAHGNIVQFVLAFLVGIFMAHIDIKHNSLIPSIFVHFSINTLSTISSIAVTTGSFAAIFFIGLIVLGLAITGLVMFIFFRMKNTLPFTMPHQKMRGGTIAVTSWSIILSVAVFLLNFILNM